MTMLRDWQTHVRDTPTIMGGAVTRSESVVGERIRFGAECQGVDHESKGSVRCGMSGHMLCVVNSCS